MYFDTAYIAKIYCNEPDSTRVRELIAAEGAVVSSQIAALEFASVLHRHVRQGTLSSAQAKRIHSEFEVDIAARIWRLAPVTEKLLAQTSTRLLAAPADLFLRAADAVHLQTAREAGETEIWTNDRHMLNAAAHFGLRGRSVEL